MKNLLIIIFTTISFFGISQDCTELTNKTFGDNEFLKYRVYYNWKDVWMKAGMVSFEVEEEKLNTESVYHITAIGKTYPFYNLFYKVNDKYETYVDRETVLPKKFVRDVHEGGFKLDHTYDFNRETMKVHTVSKVNKHKPNIKNFSFNSCTQDMLSVLYFMRNIDFKSMVVEDEKPVEVFLDNEFYNLSMIYKGKATIETEYGNIRCLKVVPKVISGRVFKDEESLIVYVSDDENKIPILIETPLSVGSIKVLLIDYKNLRNDFTSIL